MFNRFNPFARARAAEQNAADLSGLLIEARGNEQKLLVEAVGYRGALSAVVATARSVNTPNGTTRKILRIAENAL